MKREVYLVQIGDGFLGYRRGGWNGDRHDITHASFEHARIYTRRSDAQRSAEYYGGAVFDAALVI